MGNVGVSLSQHGTGMIRNHLAKRFVGELERVAEQTAQSTFTQQALFQIARDLHLPIPNLAEFIQSLNYQGYLLKRGNNSYKLMSAGL